MNFAASDVGAMRFQAVYNPRMSTAWDIPVKKSTNVMMDNHTHLSELLGLCSLYRSHPQEMGHLKSDKSCSRGKVADCTAYQNTVVQFHLRNRKGSRNQIRETCTRR